MVPGRFLASASAATWPITCITSASVSRVGVSAHCPSQLTETVGVGLLVGTVPPLLGANFCAYYPRPAAGGE